MFWHMAGLSATSPVESLLDRDGFTLEELLDEDDLIQECKSLNNRLINFLRGRNQVEQLIKYIIDEPSAGDDNKRVFKFPFISCEIFACEIEILLNTLVEDEELMDLLFSFVRADRPHGTLLAGYFSKVVICLLMRKPSAVMRYLQAHQEILKQLVDLISITSIMEVLIRLIGADDTVHACREDSRHWLADTGLLEMLLDKLGPLNSSEAHANAAEALSAVSCLSQSELATKVSSPSFIQMLFNQALEAKDSRSTLVHSLTVCISLLGPKTYVVVGMGRGQQIPDSSVTTNPEVIDSMLQRLGDLLKVLDLSEDETILPTTYGELRPPLGTYRLKVLEILAILLRTKNENVQQEFVRLGAIKLILKLFFDYPFNNLLHHQVENIVIACIESNCKFLIDHILLECDLVSRILQTDQNPYVLSTDGKPTVPTSTKTPPKVGNLGHLTRFANKLIQIGNCNPDIREHLQANPKWVEWQTSTLAGRNMIENVSQWACGRPSTVRDQVVDSDDDVLQRDYSISTMASNLTREVFRYGVFDNEDADEGIGITERDDHDVFFDDETAEMVMSSLRLGEEHDRGISSDSFLSGSNWFSQSFLGHRFEENNTANRASSSDDEVVVGEDNDLADTATSSDAAFFPVVLGNGPNMTRTQQGVSNSVLDLSHSAGKLSISDNSSSENLNTDPVSLMSLDWANWKEPSVVVGTSGRIIFSDNNPFIDAGTLMCLSEEDKQQEESEDIEFSAIGVVEQNAGTVLNDEHTNPGGHESSMPKIQEESGIEIVNAEETLHEDERSVLTESITEGTGVADMDEKLKATEIKSIKETQPNIRNETLKATEMKIIEETQPKVIGEAMDVVDNTAKQSPEGDGETAAAATAIIEETMLEGIREAPETMSTEEETQTDGIQRAHLIHHLKNPLEKKLDPPEDAESNDANCWPE